MSEPAPSIPGWAYDAASEAATESTLDFLSNPLSALKDRLRALAETLPPSLARTRALGTLDHCATLSDNVHTIARSIDQMSDVVALVLTEAPHGR